MNHRAVTIASPGGGVFQVTKSVAPENHNQFFHDGTRAYPVAPSWAFYVAGPVEDYRPREPSIYHTPELIYERALAPLYQSVPEPLDRRPLKINLRKQSAARAPDDTVCLAGWMALFLLPCKIPKSKFAIQRPQDPNLVELKGGLLRLLAKHNPSNEILFLAMYYIRKMQSSIQVHTAHGLEECQRQECVAHAIEMVYKGILAVCRHDSIVANRQFRFPLRLRDEHEALRALKEKIEVYLWHQWLRTLLSELPESVKTIQEARCAGMVRRVLDMSLTQM